MLKATPSTEGADRFVYLEASNEARDYQGEVVMAKALAESADYFQKYGNLDIQHRSLIGLANGEHDYHLHEIGRPDEVRVDGSSTFVKGVIFSGEGQAAAAANNFWDSITKLNPPMRWYPSVAGKITGSEKFIDPDTKQPRRRITKVVWANVGFSRTPVNPKVPTVSTVPFGVLAKCWGTGGLDLTKALEAGYGTDSATLTGGAALREQSLDGAPQTYPEFRDRLVKAIKAGKAGRSLGDFRSHARKLGLPESQADEWSGLFIDDLKRDTQ